MECKIWGVLNYFRIFNVDGEMRVIVNKTVLSCTIGL